MMQTNTLIQTVDLTGVRIMGAPSRPSAWQKQMARRAQRNKLDLPPIQA